MSWLRPVVADCVLGDVMSCQQGQFMCFCRESSERVCCDYFGLVYIVPGEQLEEC